MTDRMDNLLISVLKTLAVSIVLATAMAAPAQLTPAITVPLTNAAAR